MKPLIPSLCLFAQSFKKVAFREFRELYLEALDAQEEAKQIFGVEPPFILDKSRNEELGEYVWRYDVYKIFYKRIKTLCQKYDVDFESIICFCLCHETGHAKEQRLFEEIGFFPNITKTQGEMVLTKIESTNYVLPSREFDNIFSCGISDFSINKELAKHNVKNQLAKRYFLTLQVVNALMWILKKNGIILSYIIYCICHKLLMFMSMED